MQGSSKTSRITSIGLKYYSNKIYLASVSSLYFNLPQLSNNSTFGQALYLSYDLNSNINPYIGYEYAFAYALDSVEESFLVLGSSYKVSDSLIFKIDFIKDLRSESSISKAMIYKEKRDVFKFSVCFNF